jgi:tetratricopeptide (TPR) repeat protein
MKNSNKTLLKAEHEFTLKRYAKCIELLDELLVKEPNNIQYLNLKGEACLRLENYPIALTLFAQLVERNNKNLVALNNFSVALIRMRKNSEAKDILEYLIELDPQNLGAHINLCTVYQSLNQPENALKMAFKAVAIDPMSSMAYNNLGTALGDLRMIEEARQALLTAIEIKPDNISTVINLAQIEEKLANRREAIRLYEKALTNPNISASEAQVIKYYLSYSYLYFGELEKGWDHYDYGFGSLLPVGALRSSRPFKQPKWEGESLEGKKLLVWREQGLGDEIEFSTCLHDLHALECEVIFECDRRLIAAYQRTFPKFTVRGETIGSDGYPLFNDFDFQSPIGSLPKFFRRHIEDFQNKNILFSPLHELKQKFVDRLSIYRHKKCIGISWRSGKLSIARNENYTALSDWKELLIQPDFQFVNLQYGDPETELLEIETALGIQILRWPDVDLKNDLESVLALCSCLDSVVSVGTAVSSLAPAVGTTTFMLTKQNWIQLGQKDTYPWYKYLFPIVASRDEHIASKIADAVKFIKDI